MGNFKHSYERIFAALVFESMKLSPKFFRATFTAYLCAPANVPSFFIKH